MTPDHPLPHSGHVAAQAFRGVRYAVTGGDLAARTFVPPDSWAQHTPRSVARLDPHHLLRLLSPVFSAYGSLTAASTSAELLGQWFATGELTTDEVACMYVYRRRQGDELLVGVVVALELGDDDQVGLLPHEEVLATSLQAQEAFETVTHAQLEPVIAITADAPGGELRAAVASALEKPATQTVVEGMVTHELWAVADTRVHRSVQTVVDHGPLLIADGHHRHAAWKRAAAAVPRDVAVGTPQSYGLTMIVDSEHDALRLGSVHRVIRGVTMSTVLESGLAATRPLASREDAEAFLRAGPQDRCVIVAREDSGATAWHAVLPATGADRPAACQAPEYAVCWLHTTWLPAWGNGAATVEYVHGVDTAVGRAEELGAIAVLLPAPSLGSVFAAARRGAPLPAKATSFGPKPRVGMVMRHWAAGGTDIGETKDEQPVTTGPVGTG